MFASLNKMILAVQEWAKKKMYFINQWYSINNIFKRKDKENINITFLSVIITAFEEFLMNVIKTQHEKYSFDANSIGKSINMLI